MITVCVPDESVASALGDLGPHGRVIVWDPRAGDIAAAERDRLNIAVLQHYAGGREVYARLAACQALRLVQLPSAGFEHALPFVPAGVYLANARGVHDARVAEMTLALILASVRRLPQFHDAQREGTWAPEYFTPGLAGQRALIVGYGSIAQAIASRLVACEVEVEGIATTARVAPDGVVVHAVADLATRAASADILVVVAPLDQSTEGLIDANVLAALPDGALVVNVGRGKVVDTDALLAELNAGRLKAALDVTDPEPLPHGHPLWAAPGCIVVPHVAGGEPLTSERFVRLISDQVKVMSEGGKPINTVAQGVEG